MSSRPVVVLLVEDNPGDSRLIRESLSEAGSESFELEIADRLATALERMRHNNVDAILLDLALPDSTGQETFSRAKAQAPEVPIIVLTGLGDEALALKMVQNGAQDYLPKSDLNGNVLSRTIRYAIERSAAEHQIRKLNQELERKVRERTAELEAANRELEAFTYSISHDLRAPIRHIDGFSSILAESSMQRLDASGQDCLHGIRAAVLRMSAMTEDLLKLARIGEQPLMVEMTDLNQVVRQVVSEFKSEIDGRHIDWKIGDLSVVRCDPGLIQQVFANLIGNAIKYTRNRSIAVIEIGQREIEGQPAIYVRDNGAGFDLTHADKLFSPFQRFHAHEDFEGTGVGLSIVQSVVQKQGGRVWAEAEPQKGATFYFTLNP